MKIISGGVSSKKKRRSVFLVLALVLSLTVLFSVAYQKGKTESVQAGNSEYLYDIYGDETEVFYENTQADKHNILVLGKDYDSNRTDAIICVSVNKTEGTVSTLQIPRDTYISDGDYSGRVNTLLPRYKTKAEKEGAKDPLSAGIAQLSAKIYTDFGIKCHNYIFMDSAAVAALTDALGGVSLDVPADIDYTDEERDIDLHLKEGMQTLNGEQAAQFVRYREGYPQADIGRIDAQKLYAAAMFDKLVSLGSVKNAAKLAEVLACYVKTDLTAEQIAALAAQLCLTETDKVIMYTLPGNGVTVNGASYYGAYRGLLAELVSAGFGEVSAHALKVPDFYATVDGGYTDTEGVKLSSVLDHGIAIPVYAN